MTHSHDLFAARWKEGHGHVSWCAFRFEDEEFRCYPVNLVYHASLCADRLYLEEMIAAVSFGDQLEIVSVRASFEVDAKPIV